MAKDGAARLRLRPVGAADRKQLPEYGPLGTGCPAIERAVAALYKGQNEESFWALMNAINKIAETYAVPVIFSTHPRSMKFIQKRNFVFHPLVQNVKPLGFMDYNKLQRNSLLVLSDSGTLSEESAMLGFTGVLIRTSTERPEVLDKGTVVIGGITEKSVLQAAELALDMDRGGELRAMPADYVDTNVSAKVIRLIQSYTPIVNETVWLKNPVSASQNDV